MFGWFLNMYREEAAWTNVLKCPKIYNGCPFSLFLKEAMTENILPQTGNAATKPANLP